MSEAKPRTLEDRVRHLLYEMGGCEDEIVALIAAERRQAKREVLDALEEKIDAWYADHRAYEMSGDFPWGVLANFMNELAPPDDEEPNA